MPTLTGIADIAGGFTDKWLRYQEIKHGVDLEGATDDVNIPDRVDLDYNQGGAGRGVGGGPLDVRNWGPWHYFGIAALATITVGVGSKLLRR